VELEGAVVPGLTVKSTKVKFPFTESVQRRWLEWVKEREGERERDRERVREIEKERATKRQLGKGVERRDNKQTAREWERERRRESVCVRERERERERESPQLKSHIGSRGGFWFVILRYWLMAYWFSWNIQTEAAAERLI
jgi:hypothetical protein